MIENLSIQSSLLENEGKFQLTFSWQWVSSNDTDAQTNCWVLCHAVSEEEVLEASCFQSSEILRWYNTVYLPLKPDNNRRFLGEAQRLVQQKSDDAKLNFYAMQNNVQHFHNIEFEAEYSAKVFVISIFSETENEKKTIVYSRPHSDIQFSIQYQKPKNCFGRIIGKIKSTLGAIEEEPPMLMIHTNDNRRKVLICRRNGGDTYSILPGRCREFYLAEGLDENSIEIAYLSSLINSNENL